MSRTAGNVTVVGIGLIARAGRYLIRQRPDLPGSPMPGYWEFPGGKCHDGETPAEATLRECLEETGLVVRLERSRRVVRHNYPHGEVELHFFDCTTIDLHSEPALETGFRWVGLAELPGYRFPGANETVVADLIGEHLGAQSGGPGDPGVAGPR